MLHKCHFLAIFSRSGSRALKFSARHRIENQKPYILCIYNILISLKVAEIERFEVFELGVPLAQDPGKNKVPPLKSEFLLEIHEKLEKMRLLHH